MSIRRFVVLLLAVGLAGTSLSTTPASTAEPSTPVADGPAPTEVGARSAVGAESYEVRYVPTVGDAVIRVEIWRNRNFDAKKQPVLLTYSPYNSLAEPEPARDALGETYLPRGYARAVADVLGTRGSTGCWDYGGRAEQQSGVDVVRWLAKRPWSNGRVAMIGGSYNGTTASMVAARGPDVPQLRAVVPISAISRWYGYAYGNGVRYLLNSRVPTDEGFDTPLAFDAGFGRTVAADPMGPHFADTLRDRAGECGAGEHTEEGYSRNPDYDQFWTSRDYRRHARDFRAAVLLAHGWQDFNVKQEEATELFRRIPVDRRGTHRVEGVPFKMMYLTQGSHSGGTDGEAWDGLLRRFLAHTLKGRPTGVRALPPVLTQRMTSSGARGFSGHRDYPLPETEPTRLWLRRSGDVGRLSARPSGRRHVASYPETGSSTEEASADQVLSYVSPRVEEPTRMVGSAVLNVWVRVSSETMHVTPVLFDVAPDGSRQVVERGFQHVDYRHGLRSADPVTDTWVRARVRLLPQDYTLAAGHRFELRVQSSNTVWAVPGNPGTVDVLEGPLGSRVKGSSLKIPTLRRAAVFSR